MSSNKKEFNLQNDRYKLFFAAKDWMHAFLKLDEAKGMNHSEIVKKILEDILAGRVSEEDLEKSRKVGLAVEAKAEEKQHAKK